jgi:hypothetical protein
MTPKLRCSGVAYSVPCLLVVQRGHIHSCVRLHRQAAACGRSHPTLHVSCLGQCVDLMSFQLRMLVPLFQCVANCIALCVTNNVVCHVPRTECFANCVFVHASYPRIVSLRHSNALCCMPPKLLCLTYCDRRSPSRTCTTVRVNRNLFRVVYPFTPTAVRMLLGQSGVGPSEQLHKVGVPLVAENRYIGKDIMDHSTFTVNYLFRG